MSEFRFDRLLDLLTSAQVVVGILWLGLAALTVSLFILMRTRWGQSRPLRKCMILSLLAHLLLAGYATTVHIVASTPSEAREPVVRVSLDDGKAESGAVVEEPNHQEPWESLAHESTVRPNPAEPLRVGPPEKAPPRRRIRPDSAPLPADSPLEHLALAETDRPEPEVLPSDGPPDRHVPAKQPEPIRAPAPRRNEGVRSDVPGGPEPKRSSYSKSSPSSEPVRTIPSGVPSPLADEFAPLPRMVHDRTSPDPRESLEGTEDLLPRPAKGEPADLTFSRQDRDIAGPSRQIAEIGDGPSGPPADHLAPPSTASRGGRGSTQRSPEKLRSVSVAPGPPRLPAAHRFGAEHHVPEVYKLRLAPDRSRLAERMGATAETEEAVRRALVWLADNQEPDGRWNPTKHGAGRELLVAGRDRAAAGVQADTGMTGLALLAFLAAGHTHRDGNYVATVRRGLAYLTRQQSRDGGLGGNATTFAYMYCHAMAAIALSEAYAMTGDTALRDPVRRAVAYITGAQNRTSGGWRYYPGDPGDTSQLGWQLMALKSAQLAGIPVPSSAWRGAERFLASVSSGDHGGLAAYRPGEKISRPMTAEALASRQFLGTVSSHGAAKEGADYLLGELPGQGDKNLYYWYYGSLAMYQLQGVHWDRWNEALRATLLDSQRRIGSQSGSWDPDTIWGGYGGRVYSTAMAALCLEVYYRFLPLYVEIATDPRSLR